MAINDGSTSISARAGSPIANTTVDQRWEPEASSTSSAIASAEVKLDSLAIDESKKEKQCVFNDPEDIIIQSVTVGETPYTSAMRFEELNISPELLKGLYVEMKFGRPSKIQSISLPMILTPPYKSLIAQAHNGSGKTTCFLLGMLSRIDPNLDAPQALCICPTRELAIQNMEVLLKMGKFSGITSELGIPAIFPGGGRRATKITSQVIIGTPGTINKWTTTNNLDTNKLKILVFDEADHMLAQSGFRDESMRVMKKIGKSSPQCQVLLFSATFDEAVKDFVSRIMKEFSLQEYNQLFVKKEELALDSIKQYRVKVPDEVSKILVIKDKIMELGQKVGQTIIFVRTRKNAGMLHEALREYGYEVTTIQGALNQEDRDKIVKEFKDGLTQVLISSDVLARGFDQSQVNLVVNFDLPIKYDSPSEPDCEVYLHRMGRAGRFGRKGAVFNLLCGNRDAMIMEKIERHFNHSVTEVASWESDEEFEDALKKAGLM